MDILIIVAIAAGGIIALGLIFKFLAGCLLRLLLILGVLAAAAFLIFSVLRR